MVERGRVFPPFTKGVRRGRRSPGRVPRVARRATADVPRTAAEIVDRLHVAEVAIVVAAPMTEIDATHERDIRGRLARASDDQELLVVTAATAHPLVEKYLAAGAVHCLGEPDIVLLCEVCLARMRTPQQPTDLYTTFAPARRVRARSRFPARAAVRRHRRPSR